MREVFEIFQADKAVMLSKKTGEGHIKLTQN